MAHCDLFSPCRLALFRVIANGPNHQCNLTLNRKQQCQMFPLYVHPASADMDGKEKLRENLAAGCLTTSSMAKLCWLSFGSIDCRQSRQCSRKPNTLRSTPYRPGNAKRGGGQPGGSWVLDGYLAVEQGFEGTHAVMSLSSFGRTWRGLRSTDRDLG